MASTKHNGRRVQVRFAFLYAGAWVVVMTEIDEESPVVRRALAVKTAPPPRGPRCYGSSSLCSAAPIHFRRCQIQLYSPLLTFSIVRTQPGACTETLAECALVSEGRLGQREHASHVVRAFEQAVSDPLVSNKRLTASDTCLQACAATFEWQTCRTVDSVLTGA